MTQNNISSYNGNLFINVTTLKNIGISFFIFRYINIENVWGYVKQSINLKSEAFVTLN